jgi:pimeloyl-ACP methyl ester carboxylesterase
MWLPTLFTESSSFEVIEENATIMGDFRPARLQPMLNACSEVDLRHILTQVEFPILLRYGEKDQRFSLNVARELHANIPKFKLVVISGFGHVSNMEDPERFYAEVRRFLHSHYIYFMYPDIHCVRSVNFRQTMPCISGIIPGVERKDP